MGNDLLLVHPFLLSGAKQIYPGPDVETLSLLWWCLRSKVIQNTEGYRSTGKGLSVAVLVVNAKLVDKQRGRGWRKGYTRNNQLNPHGTNSLLPLFSDRQT